MGKPKSFERHANSILLLVVGCGGLTLLPLAQLVHQRSANHDLCAASKQRTAVLGPFDHRHSSSPFAFIASAAKKAWLGELGANTSVTPTPLQIGRPSRELSCKF